MEIQEAVDLLRDAVGESTGIWADLGAGTGTFTLALAELLGGGTIYAVDDDASAIRALGELQAVGGTRIVPVKADFTHPVELPGLGGTPLDGLLMANALHFVSDATGVLSRLVQKSARRRASHRRGIRPTAGEPVGTASNSGGELANARGRGRARRRDDHGHATVDVFGNSLCRCRDTTVSRDAADRTAVQ